MNNSYEQSMYNYNPATANSTTMDPEAQQTLVAGAALREDYIPRPDYTFSVRGTPGQRNESALPPPAYNNNDLVDVIESAGKGAQVSLGGTLFTNNPLFEAVSDVVGWGALPALTAWDLFRGRPVAETLSDRIDEFMWRIPSTAGRVAAQQMYDGQSVIDGIDDYVSTVLYNSPLGSPVQAVQQLGSWMGTDTSLSPAGRKQLTRLTVPSPRELEYERGMQAYAAARDSWDPELQQLLLAGNL